MLYLLSTWLYVWGTLICGAYFNEIGRPGRSRVAVFVVAMTWPFSIPAVAICLWLTRTVKRCLT